MAVRKSLKYVREESYWDVVLAQSVTHRYVWSNGRLQPVDRTKNSGIASYICEALCTRGLPGIPVDSLEIWAGLLVSQICCEAVSYGDFALWRWETQPTRPDYQYPPDWDDVCKSVDAIRAYEERFLQDANVTLPPSSYFERALEALVYESACAGEEVEHRCRNQRALFMFMVGQDQKGNNTEDIMVTAIAVRCLVRHYQSVFDRNESLIRELISRLIEVASWGLNEDVPFHHISRCYFSWAHFLLVLSDIGELVSGISMKIESLASQYLSGEQYESLLPGHLRYHLLHDEIAYCTLLAESVGHRSRRDFAAGMGTIEEPHFQIMYRHRRLGHYYGSPVWSTVLRSLCMIASEPQVGEYND